jgi:valyl-tRNA synthetase
MRQIMDKAYEAAAWEPRLYQAWENAGLFNPDKLPGKRRGIWSCVLPPPNATGVLHVGHVVMVAYQDALARFERLRGKKVLWIPGTDHAAIATQAAVEKKILKEEGKTRHDLGREQFLARVHAFVANAQGTIRQQLRATGTSLDWSREAFTLDEPRAAAVRAAFKRLYDDELIYRGLRVVNWCTRCGSTLADDEVEHSDETTGTLYVIQYGPVQVATTRPETKLGDTALAVHPSDERYAALVGQTLDISLAGHPVKVKIIADREVDPNFGTGVVGVTPAHSATDERMSQRHALPSVQVIGEDGKMTSAAGSYAGLTVAECRQRFVADLRAAGQLLEEREHIMSVGVCYRCGTPVEPLPKEQWFVAVDKKPKSGGSSFKDRLRQAVDGKHITFTPPRFEQTYRQWTENLHDWCVSRQIWYGHRVPAFHYADNAIAVPKQAPVEVLWTRHGSTDMTEQNIIQGSGKKTDTELSDEGHREADHLAASLKGSSVDIILCSPLKRANETAATVGAALGLKVTIEPLLIERNYGAAEGKTIADVERDFPTYATHRRTAVINGAETAEQLEARAIRLFKKLHANYAGKRVLCVTHNGLLRAALHHLTNKEMETTAERISPAEVCVGCRTILAGPSPKTGTWNCKQDPDTLDTWFSSSLWTFSTLGWPQKTKDLKTYHPTDILETGYEIISTWVSRMIMMSHYLLNQWPFGRVYLHGIVRDEQGRKMSKSLGNGIDPLKIIPRYGADALRLALTANATPGVDMKLSEEKISGFRNFANKLWNIGRFVLHAAPDAKPTWTAPKPKTPAEEWILARLQITIAEVTADLENLRFSHAVETLHHFTWDELADWYLEVAKLQPNPKLLAYLLTQTLAAWHPFCPFVTEAVWEHFAQPKKPEELLIVQSWPRVQDKGQRTKDKGFEIVRDVVTQIRAQRAELNVDAGTAIGVIATVDKTTAKLLTQYQPFIERAAQCTLQIAANGTTTPTLTYQIARDEAKVAREKTELEKYITSLKSKLADKSFTGRAPATVVDEQRQKLAEAQSKLQQLG